MLVLMYKLPLFSHQILLFQTMVLVMQNLFILNNANHFFSVISTVAAEQVLPFPMSNQATSSVSVNSVLNASSLPHVPTLSDSNASNMLRNVIQTNGSNSSAFLSNGNAQAAAYSMMGSATAANSANANMVGANQMLQSNSASVPQLSMLASQNAQQNSYFMQPALYLNPNAQPVYYRTGVFQSLADPIFY